MKLRSLRIFLVFISFITTPCLASQQCQETLSHRSPIDFKAISPDRQALELMIESATGDLISLNNLNRLDGLLSLIERPSPPGVDVALYQTLKLARKKWIILRSAFQLATKDHEVPVELDRMVRSLGHLNDLLAYGPKKRIQSEAAKVRKHLKEFRESRTLEKRWKLASAKNLLKYLHDKREHIENILGKQTISVDEFHKVRKDLKVFLAFFSFFEIKGESSQSTYQDLNNLVTAMGEVNDVLTEKMLNGLLAKKDKISFPKELRDQIETLFAQLSFTPSKLLRGEQILLR